MQTHFEEISVQSWTNTNKNNPYTIRNMGIGQLGKSPLGAERNIDPPHIFSLPKWISTIKVRTSWFTTKMFYPTSFKSRNSGSEIFQRPLPRGVVLVWPALKLSRALAACSNAATCESHEGFPTPGCPGYFQEKIQQAVFSRGELQSPTVDAERDAQNLLDLQ